MGSYMSGRSKVWTQAAYSSSSSLEMRIFSPSTNISLLNTQFGRATEGVERVERWIDAEEKSWDTQNLSMHWANSSVSVQREEMDAGASLWFCVILSYMSAFILTRYSGRHVGRKMDQQLFGLLLFILLSLREAALFIQAKAVISCEALQKSAYGITLFLKEKPDITSVVRKQDVVVFCHIHKLIISTQDLQTTKSWLQSDVTDVVNASLESNPRRQCLL